MTVSYPHLLLLLLLLLTAGRSTMGGRHDAGSRHLRAEVPFFLLLSSDVLAVECDDLLPRTSRTRSLTCSSSARQLAARRTMSNKNSTCDLRLSYMLLYISSSLSPTAPSRVIRVLDGRHHLIDVLVRLHLHVRIPKSIRDELVRAQPPYPRRSQRDIP